jgi:membrane protease YdiL (CAAX protease family)
VTAAVSARLPAQAANISRERTVGGGVLIALGAGGLVLLARPAVNSVVSERSLVVLFMYATLLTISLTPALPHGSAAPLRGWTVSLAGIAAVLLASWAGGPAVPLVISAWAIPLNLAAAVAEEAYFRRLAYGALNRWGAAIAIIGSALAFALMHVPLYGPAAFWVDLGAGLFLGWQRWASGGWTASTVSHAAANLLAVLR